MSNRKRLELPKPQALPTVAAPFCDTYRYNVDNGVLVIWGGMAGTWQTGMAITLPLAIDLHQKLGASLADILRQQNATQEKPNE